MYEKTWSLRRWWRLDVATPVRDRFWGDCRKREVKQKRYAVMRGLVMEFAVLTSYFAVVTCHTGLCSVYTCPGWQRITARTTNFAWHAAAYKPDQLQPRLCRVLGLWDCQSLPFCCPYSDCRTLASDCTVHVTKLRRHDEKLLQTFWQNTHATCSL